MPFFNYTCQNEECKTNEEYLVSYSEREKPRICKVCGVGEAVYTPSYLVNVTGLPNGYSATRGSSRIKKDNSLRNL